jgi:hypothetical protein
VGTIPADTRPGPQTVYFLGKDYRGILSSYIALYNVAPLTRPQIVAPKIDLPTGTFQFQVQTASNLLYQVQTAPNLRPPVQWTPNVAFTGDGSLISMGVPLASASSGFVRLLASAALPPVDVA